MIRLIQKSGLLLIAVLPFLLPPQVDARPKRVVGQVTDLDGKPVANATVKIINEEKGLDWTAETKKNGKWAILGLEGQVWKFVVTAEGYAPYEVKRSEEELGRKPTLDVELAPVAVASSAAVAVIPEGQEGAGTEVDLADLQTGNTFFDNGQYQEAIDSYKSALEKNPTLWKINFNIAEGYAKLEDWASAKTYYDTILAEHPEEDRALSGIAFVYLKQGDLEKGLEHLKKAVALNPTDPNANFQAGQVLFNQGNAEEAKSFFEAAVEANPDWAAPHQQLGYVNMNLGESEAALAHFQKYLELSPEAPDAEFVKETIEMLK